MNSKHIPISDQNSHDDAPTILTVEKLRLVRQIFENRDVDIDVDPCGLTIAELLGQCEDAFEDSVGDTVLADQAFLIDESLTHADCPQCPEGIITCSHMDGRWLPCAMCGWEE